MRRIDADERSAQCTAARTRNTRATGAEPRAAEQQASSRVNSAEREQWSERCLGDGRRAGSTAVSGGERAGLDSAPRMHHCSQRRCAKRVDCARSLAAPEPRITTAHKQHAPSRCGINTTYSEGHCEPMRNRGERDDRCAARSKRRSSRHEHCLCVAACESTCDRRKCCSKDSFSSLYSSQSSAKLVRRAQSAKLNRRDV